ncbi:aminotransferase-like domain-containing protein [Actibacterium pelagium]|uniref:Aminotransferase n=1 Tax=Actibacterium pelagium TaxID=2029103 RepID=A0A917EJY6_9RHOB|nr:PLP-dependent aminotransferase family protein [Actibacterium pelagium]GGE53091.1 aminotransferase [Actibacterium pelagium]
MSLTDIFATRSSRMKASEIRELLKLLEQPDIISFAGGIPDPNLFPMDAFREALAEAMQEPGSLQYSATEGYAPLRSWLAEQMTVLEVPCSAKNILITSGSQQALDHLGKLFLSPGDTTLLGWPTYLGALGAFNAYEPRYDRLDPGSNRAPEDFAAAAAENGGQVKMAYLSVDFCNPTGVTQTRDERLQVLHMADALDCAVIEDAAYQSLRFDGEALPPILALEIAKKGDIDKCRTIYCGSFSKTLSPGLRVGWVCAAEEVIQQLVLQKQAGDLHSPTLNQIAIEKVARRHFLSHVATIKSAYRARRDAMLAALEKYMPEGVDWTRPEGGMFIWMTLPPSMDSQDIFKTAVEEKRVAFVPGSPFYPDGTGANTMRLNFSNANEDMITEGVSRLAEVIRAAMAA